MNQQKTQPDFQYMSEVFNEVIGEVKFNSLEPIIKIFMDSLDSKGYQETEILGQIANYLYSKDALKHSFLISQLDKAVKEVGRNDGENAQAG